MRRLDPQSLSQHLDVLYRAAWALCGSREDAEDLVQETFARVLARPRFVRSDTDRAYLMSVLRNTFFTAGRVASRRPKVTTTLDDVQAPESRTSVLPDVALEVRELFDVIAELPEDFRLTLVAVDIVGLSYAEAGRALGVREATITTRLFRARQRVAHASDHQTAPGSERMPEGRDPSLPVSDRSRPVSPTKSLPAREGTDPQTRLAQ